MVKHLIFSAAALLAAALLVPALVAPARAQALPSSLQGELFIAAVTTGTFPGGIGAIEVTSDPCTARAGEVMTIGYTAEGEALGPYPGPYRETGEVTAVLDRRLAPGYAEGHVLSWTAEFTIDSPAGQVSGNKTLSTLFSNFTFALCKDEHRTFTIIVTSTEEASAYLHYEATIKTSAGTFTDQGEASTHVLHEVVEAPAGTGLNREEEYFFEDFFLSEGVLPVDTTGKATGGGRIHDITLSGGVTFAFEAEQPELGELQGRCLVNDSASSTKVKCLTVTSYWQIGNTASWSGTAEVNGEIEDYRITVQDNGEPNQGTDTFSIKTETYEAAGNVEHGNVQLHKQE